MQPLHCGLQFSEAVFQARGFRFQHTQLAFGRQRTRFGGAAARHGAPVVTGSIRGEKNIRRILASQLLGSSGLRDKVG